MPIPTPLKVAFICKNYVHLCGIVDSLDKYLSSPLLIEYRENLKFQLTTDKQADFLANKDILEELYAKYDVVAGFLKPEAIETIIHYPPNSMKHRCRFILIHNCVRWIELY